MKAGERSAERGSCQPPGREGRRTRGQKADRHPPSRKARGRSERPRASGEDSGTCPAGVSLHPLSRVRNAWWTSPIRRRRPTPPPTWRTRLVYLANVEKRFGIVRVSLSSLGMSPFGALSGSSRAMASRSSSPSSVRLRTGSGGSRGLQEVPSPPEGARKGGTHPCRRRPPGHSAPRDLPRSPRVILCPARRPGVSLDGNGQTRERHPSMPRTRHGNEGLPTPSQSRFPGRYVPGTVRNATLRRFQPLMATIARVRSARSFSENWRRTSS